MVDAQPDLVANTANFKCIGYNDLNYKYQSFHNHERKTNAKIIRAK